MTCFDVCFHLDPPSQLQSGLELRRNINAVSPLLLLLFLALRSKPETCLLHFYSDIFGLQVMYRRLPSCLPAKTYESTVWMRCEHGRENWFSV